MLGELVGTYQPAILAFCKATTRDSHRAEDLSQAFCKQLLEGRSLNNADSEKGRFRSYLLGALKHFISDQWRKENAEKRGSNAAHESLESTEAQEIPHAINETEFDQEWALTVIRIGMDRLRDEYVDKNKEEVFEILSPWLTPAAERKSQSEAAKELGISENAIKVSIHRLRARFRTLIRQELAQTLSSEAEIDEELQHLVETLSHL